VLEAEIGFVAGLGRDRGDARAVQPQLVQLALDERGANWVSATIEIADIANTLVSLPKLRSGAYPDDVAVVVIANPEAMPLAE
jgi:hypothetical protein